jgi:hypothetical protein
MELGQGTSFKNPESLLGKAPHNVSRAAARGVLFLKSSKSEEKLHCCIIQYAVEIFGSEKSCLHQERRRPRALTWALRGVEEADGRDGARHLHY